MKVYGPHGVEVLQLEHVGPDSQDPPNCPIHGLRSQALKLIGDPNVPASKHSFVFDLIQGVYHGQYNPIVHDPFPGSHGPRPIVSFEAQQGMPAFIDLAERPVVGVFSNAVGQINRLPGEWQPEWVAATVVVYGTNSNLTRGADDVIERDSVEGLHLRGGPASFGVIFEDEGFEFRHIMDFYPLPNPETSVAQQPQPQ